MSGPGYRSISAHLLDRIATNPNEQVVLQPWNIYQPIPRPASGYRFPFMFWLGTVQCPPSP